MNLLNWPSTEKGFTLLEVVAAVVILSTSFVALVSLQTQSIHSFQRVRERLAALVLAEDRLQRLLMKAQGLDPGDMTNPELDKAYSEKFTVSEQEVIPSEGEIPPGLVFPAGWTIVKLIVQVDWQGGGETNGAYTLQRLAMVPVEFAP